MIDRISAVTTNKPFELIRKMVSAPRIQQDVCEEASALQVLCATPSCTWPEPHVSVP